MTLSVGGSGGGRAGRALRLLLLLVLALAAVEYLFGSILEASPLRTYIYQPLYNSTQVASRNTVRISSYWPKRLPIHSFSKLTADIKNDTRSKNTTHSRNHTNSPNATYTKQSSVRLEEKQNSSQTLRSSTQTTVIPEVAQNTSASLPVPNLNLMERLKILMTTEGFLEARNESDVPLCGEKPPDLGPVPVNKTDLELDEVDKKYPYIGWGGRYSPPNCTARHKVAIIVPYRDRQQHLAVFLNHMHPFLVNQQLEYGIFIIEQEGKRDFNRAKLMNVGYKESMRLKAGGWQCFVFHDIDLLPLDSRNMYSCPRQPRHMSASIDKLNFRLPYEEIFGGVSAMTAEQFTKVNGFSNKYWGWGGEDDDMFYRLKKMRYHIARYKMSIARYAMLDHKKSSPNPKRFQLLSQTNKIFQKDGLSTLQYEVVKVTQHHLFTHVLVNIAERS